LSGYLIIGTKKKKSQGKAKKTTEMARAPEQEHSRGEKKITQTHDRKRQPARRQVAEKNTLSNNSNY
jgi:hypothetical protein